MNLDMENYNIFLDDIRHPYDCIEYMPLPGIYAKLNWTIVRSYDAFVDVIDKMGLPLLISFDHDLSDVDYYQEWVKIEGFNDYSVSSSGNVRRDRVSRGTSGGMLQLGHNETTGTVSVKLTKNGIHYNKSIHRLVANAFIKNPDNKPEVNHINGNRCDNRTVNLEWCTASENIKHSHDFLNRRFGAYGSNHKNSISVTCYNILGEELNTYGSTAEAGRQLKIPYTNISKCARGERKTAGKYIWKYENKNATVSEIIEKIDRNKYEYTPHQEKTGMDVAKWLVDYCIDNNAKLPEYRVHSMNPSGSKNIQSLLDNYKKFENAK